MSDAVKITKIKEKIINSIDEFKIFLNDFNSFNKKYSDILKNNNLFIENEELSKNEDKMIVLKEKIVDDIILKIECECKNNKNIFMIFFSNKNNDVLFNSAFKIDSNNKKNEFDFDDIFYKFFSELTNNKKKLLSKKEKDEIKILISFGFEPIMNILKIYEEMNFL